MWQWKHPLPGRSYTGTSSTRSVISWSVHSLHTYHCTCSKWIGNLFFTIDPSFPHPLPAVALHVFHCSDSLRFSQECSICLFCLVAWRYLRYAYISYVRIFSVNWADKILALPILSVTVLSSSSIIFKLFHCTFEIWMNVLNNLGFSVQIYIMDCTRFNHVFISYSLFNSTARCSVY